MGHITQFGPVGAQDRKTENNEWHGNGWVGSYHLVFFLEEPRADSVLLSESQELLFHMV